MSRHCNENGFAVLEALLIVVILALIGLTGWYVWHGKHNAEITLTQSMGQNQTQSSPYTGWKTYTDAAHTYSLKYPAEWAVKTEDTTGPSSDETTFGPQNSVAIMSVMSIVTETQTNPSAIAVNPASTGKALTINGNSAYYEQVGSNPTTNLMYAIRKVGRVVTLNLTEHSIVGPQQDNSRYVGQFNLIAKSVTLKQ